MPGWNHTNTGFFGAVTIVNPGAGNAFDIVTVAGTRSRICGAFFTLTTDANVANRQVILQLRIGAIIVSAMVHPTAQVASTVSLYSLSCNFAGQPYNIGTYYMFPWNRNILINESVFLRVNALNIQAGDAFTGINWLREYMIGD